MRAYRDMTQDERRGAMVERKLARNTIRAVVGQCQPARNGQCGLTCWKVDQNIILIAPSIIVEEGILLWDDPLRKNHNQKYHDEWCYRDADNQSRPDDVAKRTGPFDWYCRLSDGKRVLFSYQGFAEGIGVSVEAVTPAIAEWQHVPAFEITLH
jgi:hypothetical protein